MEYIMNFIDQTGFVRFFADGNWKCLVMIAISLVLMYLAIVKKFEPLLLLPIAFGMLLTNIPGAEMFHEQLFAGGHVHWDLFGGGGDITAGLIDYLYLGVKLGIYPCLIFIGVGAMTDFGPLIANPKSLLLGAAAQLGIFMTFAGARLLGFTDKVAASIGIIGGADGPTAINSASDNEAAYHQGRAPDRDEGASSRIAQGEDRVPVCRNDFRFASRSFRSSACRLSYAR